jgi:hypothetical protein
LPVTMIRFSFELPAFSVLICQTDRLPGRLTVFMLPMYVSHGYWTLVRCAVGLYSISQPYP